MAAAILSGVLGIVVGLALTWVRGRAQRERWERNAYAKGWEVATQLLKEKSREQFGCGGIVREKPTRP